MNEMSYPLERWRNKNGVEIFNIKKKFVLKIKTIFGTYSEL
jgi:hypothetical protein